MTASEPEQLAIGQQRVFFTSAEDLPFLAAGTADFVMTSPPYWNLKDYGHPGQIGASDYAEYHQRLSAVWRECYRITGPAAVMVVNAGNRRHKKQFYPIAMDIAQNMPEWTLWDMLVWYIPNALPQPNHYRERLFDNKYEFLLSLPKTIARITLSTSPGCRRNTATPIRGLTKRTPTAAASAMSSGFRPTGPPM